MGKNFYKDRRHEYLWEKERVDGEDERTGKRAQGGIKGRVGKISE